MAPCCKVLLILTAIISFGQSIIIKSVNLTTSNTNDQGAKIQIDNADCKITENQWEINVTTRSQQGYHLLISLDKSWSFDPEYQSTISLTMYPSSAISITYQNSPNLLVTFSVNNSQYITYNLFLNNDKPNQIYPSCDNTNPPETKVATGNVKACVDADICNHAGQREYKASFNNNYTNILSSNHNHSNTFPITITFNNNPVQFQSSTTISSPSWNQWTQGCIYDDIFATNLGLDIYIALDDEGEKIAFEKFEIQYLNDAPTFPPTPTIDTSPFEVIYETDFSSIDEWTVDGAEVDDCIDFALGTCVKAAPGGTISRGISTAGYERIQVQINVLEGKSVYCRYKSNKTNDTMWTEWEGRIKLSQGNNTVNLSSVYDDDESFELLIGNDDNDTVDVLFDNLVILAVPFTPSPLQGDDMNSGSFATSLAMSTIIEDAEGGTGQNDGLFTGIWIIFLSVGILLVLSCICCIICCVILIKWLRKKRRKIDTSTSNQSREGTEHEQLTPSDTKNQRKGERVYTDSEFMATGVCQYIHDDDMRDVYKMESKAAEEMYGDANSIKTKDGTDYIAEDEKNMYEDDETKSRDGRGNKEIGKQDSIDDIFGDTGHEDNLAGVRGGIKNTAVGVTIDVMMGQVEAKMDVYKQESVAAEEMYGVNDLDDNKEETKTGGGEALERDIYKQQSRAEGVNRYSKTTNTHRNGLSIIAEV